MAFEELNLAPGTWLAVDCGSLPSESNCHVVIAAPESQREDLVDAATGHAADKHGHTNDEALRSAVSGTVQTVQV
ncbi:MAG: hypothetical protein JWL89_211 [Candidatus Saccharibacteria bacterium]|nr:hypothetical protein [Candidatus Saccharibacteria bacterium]